ncbi:hypothetical protein [Amycolatopsis sp.]|uniref:hypothetical protein n=1 Tax=Amycolatopsis sp. TaxID=37632 RepID=UPI002BE9C13F|nr:hypothetical protein [Amycolatopsis sp.]HVV13902.1 hypothetical protein [Amycolatopsis sp.]
MPVNPEYDYMTQARCKRRRVREDLALLRDEKYLAAEEILLNMKLAVMSAETRIELAAEIAYGDAKFSAYINSLPIRERGDIEFRLRLQANMRRALLAEAERFSV